jgi:hypothetical protein
MPFAEHYSKDLVGASWWLGYWIVKGVALYLILWTVGISKQLESRETVTDYEGGGSPAAAALPEQEIKTFIHELRRAV